MSNLATPPLPEPYYWLAESPASSYTDATYVGVAVKQGRFICNIYSNGAVHIYQGDKVRLPDYETALRWIMAQAELGVL